MLYSIVVFHWPWIGWMWIRYKKSLCFETFVCVITDMVDLLFEPNHPKYKSLCIPTCFPTRTIVSLEDHRWGGGGGGWLPLENVNEISVWCILTDL